ncbi:unnamed protein product [Parajaminaea phylloscopi]
MLRSTQLLLSSSLLAATLLAGAATGRAVLQSRQSSGAAGYSQPTAWLTTIPGSSLGEPLNVVISNASSPEVLTETGIASYFSSLFFSPNNCVGLSLGGSQQADLNDGKGAVNETTVYRYNFNKGTTTCQESFSGGEHFRLWKQENTGAYFLAASVEASATQNHMIVANGYNNGRDWFVGNATNSSGTTSPQDASAYKATAAEVYASVDPSSVNHGIAIDGKVVVLTVTRTKAGNGTDPTAASSAKSTSSSSSQSSSAAPTMQTPPWLVAGCLAILTTLLAMSGTGTGTADARPASAGRRATSTDPGVALGQQLAGHDNPDPIPDTIRDSQNAEPTAISDELRAKVLAALPLAQASYCTGTQSGVWGGVGCGPACDAVPGKVDLLWHKGDGDLDPHRLLLYLHQTQTLVLSVEGSSLKKALSVINDVAFVPLPAAPPIANSLRRFSTGVNVREEDNNLLADILDAAGNLVVSGIATTHGGFAATWARLYPEALSEVQKAIDTHRVTKVLTTGHSLGSAVALLDTIALRNDLKGKGAGLSIENIGFGSPRVFSFTGARLLDKMLANPSANVTSYHVHHDADIVPHLGPLVLGFSHSSNEIFLPDDAKTAAGNAVLCSGYENVQCSNSRALRVPVVLNSDDHSGPYLGQLLGRNKDSQCFQASDYAAKGLSPPRAAAVV